MHRLQTTKAASLWSYFLTICSIPHPSKHEDSLVDWIVNWAKEKNIACTQDSVGNLILRKDATPGCEHKTPVILQGHLDMVPQKNNDTVHDFVTDPITPIIEGEWMHANNTTLGADNGVGMASCLSVLADNTIEHGPLEVLLTTSEEIGMVGAFGLQSDTLSGKVLINTDSEQEGDLYIGCAGGVRAYVDLPYQTVPVDPSDVAYKISLNGLKGGHSGCDIHLLRANAIIVLADILTQFHALPFRLAKIEGGSLRNAIPREAHAVLTCGIQYKETLDRLIMNFKANLINRYQAVETDLLLSASSCALPKEVLTAASQDSVLAALKNCPNGIFAMDKDLDDVVQTSSNLGVLSQHDHDGKSVFTMEMLVRSQVEQEKQQSVQRIFDHFEQYGATSHKEGDYPGWKPNTASNIYQIVKGQYSKLFGAEPKTMVIHAGLECGLFSNKYPHWDMVSFGPTIKFPHSPDEKVHIPSVDKYWQLLVASLAAID
jgi:dipeptidase D